MFGMKLLHVHFYNITGTHLKKHINSLKNEIFSIVISTSAYQWGKAEAWVGNGTKQQT